MSLTTTITLFGVMLVLAFIPSVSVLTVSARTAASGFTHGVFTTLGIIVGDIFFILLAILGLAFLAEKLDSLFVFLKYFGAVYLVWMGVMLWRSKPKDRESDLISDTSLFSSFLAGLLITLGDQKAVVFYLIFFPAFIDLSAMSLADAGIIILIATLSIGIAKLTYAYLADKSSVLMSKKAHQIINRVAASVLFGIAVLLVVNANG